MEIPRVAGRLECDRVRQSQVLAYPFIEVLVVDSSRCQDDLLVAIDSRYCRVAPVYIQAHKSGDFVRDASLIQHHPSSAWNCQVILGAVEGNWLPHTDSSWPGSLPGSQLSEYGRTTKQNRGLTGPIPGTVGPSASTLNTPRRLNATQGSSAQSTPHTEQNPTCAINASGSP